MYSAMRGLLEWGSCRGIVAGDRGELVGPDSVLVSGRSYPDPNRLTRRPVPRTSTPGAPALGRSAAVALVPSTHMTPSRQTEEELLDPAYLEGLESRPLDEVRAMHEDCLVVETELSYVRRLAQARIDIVRAEMDRRATRRLGERPRRQAAGDPLGPGAALARRSRAACPAISPPTSTRHLHGDLDEVVEDGTLASLPTLSDAELEARLEELREVERDVSNRRRAMFDVIDRIEAELDRASQGRTGLAAVTRGRRARAAAPRSRRVHP